MESTNWANYWNVSSFAATIDQELIRRSAVGRDGKKVSALAFMTKLELQSLGLKCANGTYRFSPYRQLLQVKSATSAPRQMSIPQSRDFLVQKTLAKYLKENFPIRPTNPQMLVSEILNFVSGNDGAKFIKLDLTKFYDSIDLLILKNKLEAIGLQTEAVSMLLAACENPTAPDGPYKYDPLTIKQLGVPQGLPFSNYLAELYLGKFDAEMQDYFPDRYFRYVDDILILFSSADDMPDIEEIAQSLSSIKLHLNREKTNQGEVSTGFEYLGYKISTRGVSIRRSTRLKFENSLVKQIRKSSQATKSARQKAAWRINLRITGCVYKGRRIGWLQYFVHTTDLTMLAEIQFMIERMLAKEKNWNFFKPKKFLKVLEILKSPSRGVNSKYIPNFDNYTVAEMKTALGEIFGYGTKILAALSDTEIAKEFFSSIGKEIQSLERDIVTGYY